MLILFPLKVKRKIYMNPVECTRDFEFIAFRETIGNKFVDLMSLER